MFVARSETNVSSKSLASPMDKVYAPNRIFSDKSCTSGAPPTVTLQNKTTQNAVTSDSTSSTSWTEVKSRSKSTRSKNTRSKNTRSKNTRSKNTRSKNTRSKSSRSKNTRPKSSRSKDKASYKKDAKTIESVCNKLSKELVKHTKRSQNGEIEELGRTIHYLNKAGVGFPGRKKYYFGEQKAETDMGSIGDLAACVAGYTHGKLMGKIQDRMHSLLKDTMYELLRLKNKTSWCPRSGKSKGEWSAEIVGRDIILEVTPENLEYILEFFIEKENKTLLLKSYPVMWDTLSSIPVDTSNLGGSFDPFCMRLYAQVLNVMNNKNRNGIVYRAVSSQTKLEDFFFGDWVHSQIEDMGSVLSTIYYKPILPPRKVVEVVKVEEKIDLSSESAFPSLDGEVGTVDTEVVATSSAWSKSLPKPTADDIRKISEYNCQVTTQKLNELKEKKAKRIHEENDRQASIEDAALYQVAYEKALDLNDFGHGEVMDPSAVAREAQGIFEDWKDEDEDEMYQGSMEMEFEMSNLDSWEDYSDGEEDW